MTAPSGPADAISERSLREELEETRDTLRALLREASPRDAAGLARELRQTLNDLAEMAGPAKGSTVDALAARRAARQSAATGT